MKKMMAMFAIVVAVPLMSMTVSANSQATAVNAAALVQTVTVKQALSLPDDSKVRIKGYVAKSLGDEKYEFRDATGMIKVEIDDELWMGKPISSKQLVTITGEIDIDYKPTKRISIDVDHLGF